MKKLIYLLLLCPLFLSAQEDDSTAKYSLGLYATPQTYGISVHRVAPFSIYKGGWIEPKLGLSAGMNAGVEITDKLYLRSGLGYSLVRYNYLMRITLSSDILAGTKSEFENTIQYHTIHLPLILQYGRKFFGTVGIEAGYQFGSENTERVIYEGNGNITVLQRLTAEGNVNLGFQFGIGFTVPLNDNLDLLLEPLFKYDIKSYIIEDSNLYSVGLKTTINYRL